MKILIKNACIVDGTGSEPFYGSILIEDEIIQRVLRGTGGKLFSEDAYDWVIDAKGDYVAPGFIDTHTHFDLMHRVDEGLKCSIMQGVTTVVAGQCGFDVSSVPQEKQKKWQETMVIHDPAPEKPWPWKNLQEYLQTLREQGLESNFVPFVGHGALHFAITGDEARALTGAELKKIQALINEAFEQGAVGLSFGDIYVPAVFSSEEEKLAILKAVSDNQGIIAIHMRNESDQVLDALKEVIDLIEKKFPEMTSEKFKGKLHISHLKNIGGSVKLEELLALIKKHNLTFDHYPYDAGSTSLASLFPPFLLDKGETLMSVLQGQDDKSREKRAKAKRFYSGKETPPSGESWDNLPWLLGWEKIKVYIENRGWVSLQKLADEQQEDPADVMISLIVENGVGYKMIDVHSSPEDILKKVKDPRGVIGTDTLEGGHPRDYGTFPSFFKQYVFKEEPDLKIEEAVRKVSGKPAKIFGLRKRGTIKKGKQADLVIFGPDFEPHSTYENPRLFSSGLKYAFINGRVKVRNGEYVREESSGKVLSRTP